MNIKSVLFIVALVVTQGVYITTQACAHTPRETKSCGSCHRPSCGGCK